MCTSEEEKLLLERLDRRVASTKEVESTVDASSTTIEVLLPSFFELYPKSKSAYLRSGNIEILRACDHVIRTGDSERMNRLVAAHSPPPVVIEILDDDEQCVAAPRGTFRWQADGGSAGWMDYSERIEDLLECARIANVERVSFCERGHNYRVHLDTMIQINLATGTARPVRTIPR